MALQALLYVLVSVVLFTTGVRFMYASEALGWHPIPAGLVGAAIFVLPHAAITALML